MSRKTLVYIGMIVGSGIGGYIPVILGADLLSFSSLFFSLIGGLVGIWIGFKVGR